MSRRDFATYVMAPHRSIRCCHNHPALACLPRTLGSERMPVNTESADREMPRSKATDGLVAALVSAGCSSIQLAVMALQRRLDSDVSGLAVGFVWLYGAGLLFAIQLAVAGWIAGVPDARRRTPWVAMAVGQPAILVCAVFFGLLVHRMLGIGDKAVARVAMWFAALASLGLTAAVAHRRAGRWSRGAFRMMAIASATWVVVFGTGLLQRVLPQGDLGYSLSVGAWQVAFAPAYALWAWPEPQVPAEPVAADGAPRGR